MARKKPKPRKGLERPFCDNEWTRSRYFSFIRSALRGASTRWPPKYNVLKAAKTVKKTNRRTGRLAQHYRCSKCGEDFPLKEIQVHHLVDAGRLASHEDLPGFVERLLCNSDGLACLCKCCHKAHHNF